MGGKPKYKFFFILSDREEMSMADQKENREYWEIRRGSEVLCSSTVPFFGYSARVILDMYAAGYSCYRNGNRVKKCELMLA